MHIHSLSCSTILRSSLSNFTAVSPAIIIHSLNNPSSYDSQLSPHSFTASAIQSCRLGNTSHSSHIFLQLYLSTAGTALYTSAIGRSQLNSFTAVSPAISICGLSNLSHNDSQLSPQRFVASAIHGCGLSNTFHSSSIIL